jgi:hypothetical protein
MKRFLVCACIILGIFASIRQASADALGQQAQFFTDPLYDQTGAESVPATLRAVGQHGYFYVDDRYWNSLLPDQQQQFSLALNALLGEFDGVIYPKLTQFWGTESIPGIDHESNVYIFLEWLNDGNGGYFRTANNYAEDIAPKTNMHEMIYVDVASVMRGTAKNFTAHELQHLISFNQKELRRGVRDDIWLNEGRGEYSGTIVGYNTPFNGSMLQQRMWEFLKTPSDSLTEWPNTPMDYAMTAVFTEYLVEQYGPAVLAATIHTGTSGTTAVSDALFSNSIPDTFDDVFVNWMIAASLNDRTQNQRYGYVSDAFRSLHVVPVAQAQLYSGHDRSDFTTALKEWQPYWAKVDIASVTDSVTVRVVGPNDTWWRGAVLALRSDGSVAVTRIPESVGTVSVNIFAPTNGVTLQSVVPMIVQISDVSSDGRALVAAPVTLTVSLGGASPIAPTPTLTLPPQQYVPVDGDLIRRVGQSEAYVIWGKYRRYLTTDILKLYGFQDRPVHEVSDAVFFRYDASNYVRALNQKQVYAVWPDGTKHWLDITPTQWDASHRDWGAIFTVNDAEVNHYQMGKNIVQ